MGRRLWDELSAKQSGGEMKRGWKIGLIAGGAVLGVMLLVVVVAVWMVCTPSRLTRMVNSLAGNWVEAEVGFGKVDLTIFRTFPDVGLEVSDVWVVNPTEGAMSDTVATMKRLTVGLDAMRLLNAHEVVVNQLLIDGVQANLYVAADGHTNFDILPLVSDDDDTLASPFSLDSLPGMRLHKIRLHEVGAYLQDKRDGIEATVEGVEVAVEGELQEGKVEATVEVEGRRVMVGVGDSTAATTLAATMENIGFGLSGKGNMEAVEARVNVRVGHGTARVGEQEMVNAELQAVEGNLLRVEMPCKVDMQQMAITVGEGAKVQLADYALLLEGMVKLASEGQPMAVDATVKTDGKWSVGEVVKIIPDAYTSMLENMEVEAKVGVEAMAVGMLTDSTMPVVDARLMLEEGSLFYPKVLPHRIKHINGTMAARLDLGAGGRSNATVEGLRWNMLGSTLAVSGKVDDILGDMAMDVAVVGNVHLGDAVSMMSEGVGIVASGAAHVDAKLRCKMSDVQAMALERMKASLKLQLKDMDVRMDSLHATSSALEVDLTMPAVVYRGRMADVGLKGAELLVQKAGMKGRLDKPNISIGINNPLHEQVAASFDVTLGEMESTVDSMIASVGGMALKGSVRIDTLQSNPLKRINPVANVEMHSVAFYMPSLPDALRMQQLSMQYDPMQCRISTAELRVGHSDFQLYGSVDNLEDWVSHKASLRGDVNFNSGYADIDQLMDMFSGVGSDADTIEQMRQEDKVDEEAHPFIVPKDVDFTLHTHIKRSVAFGNDLNDVAGTITVKDGVVVMDQVGFVCKAATMQLSALYKSPRPNNLFCALDFHLLDIRVDELVDMIPMIDTLVPMLAALEGKANFHLAAETFLDAQYRPKMSSLLGSAAISGRDLTVMDNSTISQVAKLMQLKSWKEKDNKIRIDSVDVELTCLRKEIEVYPFVLNIGKYQICASGKHTLDNQCGYHVELLKNPLLAKVGIDIRGDIAHPKVSMGQVRYADLYKPEKQGVVEQRTLELKRMIREALEANVR